MSVAFAEKILDGMVDENGHCGDRAMSHKQFEILTECKDMRIIEVDKDCGHWSGDYARRDFWAHVWAGTIVKYAVKLREFHHFHSRYTVESIDLRPTEEYEAECRLAELAKFDGSDWVGNLKERQRMELTLVRVYEYDRYSYAGYDTETFHIYTLADHDGNCIVWKSTNSLAHEWFDDEGYWHCVTAEPGDTVTIKATVKEHSDWHGIKQTIVTRAKVEGVNKRGF